jgi:hypothetical protein
MDFILAAEDFYEPARGLASRNDALWYGGAGVTQRVGRALGQPNRCVECLE